MPWRQNGNDDKYNNPTHDADRYKGSKKKKKTDGNKWVKTILVLMATIIRTVKKTQGNRRRKFNERNVCKHPCNGNRKAWTWDGSLREEARGGGVMDGAWRVVEGGVGREERSGGGGVGACWMGCGGGE